MFTKPINYLLLFNASLSVASMLLLLLFMFPYLVNTVFWTLTLADSEQEDN